jgi:hypothetical protein
MLYQLSYAHRIKFSDARPAGVEPAARGLEGRCSIQLSYGRMLMIEGADRQAPSADSIIVGADRPPGRPRYSTSFSSRAEMPSRYKMASRPAAEMLVSAASRSLALAWKAMPRPARSSIRASFAPSPTAIT